MPGENKSAKAGRDRGLGEFSTRPLTPPTWVDLERLFDLPGGSIVRGCWCMFYRSFGSRSRYQRAGFGEVVRRSRTRVVMRRDLASPE